MSLHVDLGGSASGFKQMLDQAKMHAKAFSNSVTHEVGSSWGSIGKSFAAGIAGMFTVDAVKSGVSWFIDLGKEIKEQSEQVDMSTDAWQKWKQAVEEADLSTDGLVRTIESLRQKRTEALTDPKARGQLNQLGFSDTDITGSMDTDTYLRRALANANAGDLQRKYLADVIGNRGLKYAIPAERVSGIEPPFSRADINEASEANKDINAAKREVARGAGNLVGFTRFLYHLATWSKADWHKDAAASGQALGPYADATSKTAAAAANKSTPTGPVKDPMDPILERQREEMALQNQERQQRMLDSQRSLMTIGDRRASLGAEIEKLKKQVADRTDRAKSEDFLTEGDKQDLEGVTGKAREFAVNKLRQKYQGETDDMQLRVNRNTGELRQRPLDFSATSLSKVGLYSASAVSFNPLLGIAQRQLQVLHSIDGKLGKTPHPILGSYSPTSTRDYSL